MGEQVRREGREQPEAQGARLGVLGLAGDAPDVVGLAEDDPGPLDDLLAGVGEHDLAGLRSTSSTPSSFSSFLIWVDSVGWLTKHASAARPKWRWSATATRYRRSRRFIGHPRDPVRSAGRGGLDGDHSARRAFTRILPLAAARGRGADQVVEGAQRRGRAGAHGDDDLLVRHGGAVAGGEHAGHRGLAAVVDHDLAAGRQLDGALEPLGVGQQADLHEDAVEVDRVLVAGGAVLVDEAGDLLAVADDLGGQRARRSTSTLGRLRSLRCSTSSARSASSNSIR